MLFNDKNAGSWTESPAPDLTTAQVKHYNLYWLSRVNAIFFYLFYKLFSSIIRTRKFENKIIDFNPRALKTWLSLLVVLPFFRLIALRSYLSAFLHYSWQVIVSLYALVPNPENKGFDRYETIQPWRKWKRTMRRITLFFFSFLNGSLPTTKKKGH